MNYALDDFAGALRVARQGKGLSQRELSAKSGVPQGHISKIENGTVDLRLSSLIALARVLDLELVFVPRRSVSAVKALVSSNEGRGGQEGGATDRARKELKHIQDSISYLSKSTRIPEELVQLQRQARELQHFRLTRSDLEEIRSASKVVKALVNDAEWLDAVRQSLSRLQVLRNALAHRSADGPQTAAARPAYSLDEDEDG